MQVGTKGLAGAEALVTARVEAEFARQRALLSRRTQALLSGAGCEAEARWYVVQVRVGAEKAVDNTLTDSGIVTWVPVVMVEQTWRSGRKGGVPGPVERPAVPGYLFVRAIGSAGFWAGLVREKGVLDVLPTLERPVALPDELVNRFKAFVETDQEAGEIVRGGRRSVKAGDAVLLTAGPFASFPGVVKRLAKGGRALVEAMVFGRAVVVDVALAQISKSD